MAQFCDGCRWTDRGGRRDAVDGRPHWARHSPSPSPVWGLPIVVLGIVPLGWLAIG